MRRALLLAPILIAIATPAIKPAAALANTCTVQHLTTTYVDDSLGTSGWAVWDGQTGNNQVTCTGRFYAREAYQYFDPSTQTWRNPPGGIWAGNNYWRYATPSNNCGHLASIWASRYCWGTDDGSGGGYWGAGANATFNTNGINDFNLGDCLNQNNVNWRIHINVYDYATDASLVDTYNVEHNGTGSGC